MADKTTVKQTDKTTVKPEEQRHRIKFGKDLSFSVSEAFRLLRTSLTFSIPSSGEKCHIIGITSASAGEGKSTTALNLAYMLAEAHNQTILIEADMRLPTISKALDLKQSPGLSNALVGLSGNIVQPSGIEERLRIISSGDIPPNPSELLGSPNMKKLLESLAGAVDYIIIDLPPISEVSDALVVSQFLDGMLLVVRQHYAGRRLVADSVRQLEQVDAKVLGFVMTAVTPNGKAGYKKGYKKYRKGYGYGYGYGYGHGYGYGYGYGYGRDYGYGYGKHSYSEQANRAAFQDEDALNKDKNGKDGASE